MKVSSLIKLYLVLFAVFFLAHIFFNTPFTIALMGIWAVIGVLTILDRRIDPKVQNPNRDMAVIGVLMALAGVAIYWLFPQYRDTSGPVIFLTLVVYIIFTLYRWLVDWELPDFHLSYAREKLITKISQLRKSGRNMEADAYQEILYGMTIDDLAEAKSIASRVMTAKSVEDLVKIRQQLVEKGVIVLRNQDHTKKEET